MGRKKVNREKPAAYRLRGPDGRSIGVGIGAAAEWLGLSRTTLRRIITGRGEASERTIDRVRQEFPALFIGGDA